MSWEERGGPVSPRYQLWRMPRTYDFILQADLRPWTRRTRDLRRWSRRPDIVERGF